MNAHAAQRSTVAPMTHAADDHGHPSVVDRQAEILDLDAEVLADHTASIIEWLPVKAGPRRIVDLGCGTGAGTFALLAQFPEAHVTAVDSSIEHLHRLHEKACATGVADHVRTVQADLDEVWPDFGEPDLVWASASLHHMADPDRILRRVHDTLAPGGLFAVVEVAGFPGSCPTTPHRTGPASRSGCTPSSTATTPRTCPTAAPTGAPG
jgi:ubiquinone/menaquinone biosynthesis C-methylase UbiE